MSMYTIYGYLADHLYASTRIKEAFLAVKG
jgi:hypothetical protein